MLKLFDNKKKNPQSYVCETITVKDTTGKKHFYIVPEGKTTQEFLQELTSGNEDNPPQHQSSLRK